MLHMKVCLSSPRTEQFLPPNCGSGLLHDRVLKRTPVPQDLVHLENTVQCEYPPSSAKSLKEKLFFTISKASIIVIHPLLTMHLENTVQCEYPPSSAKSLKEKLFFTISKASIIVIHPLLTQQH